MVRSHIVDEKAAAEKAADLQLLLTHIDLLRQLGRDAEAEALEAELPEASK